jgi:uncharacterized ferritin-like protein (DUF455 family)
MYTKQYEREFERNDLEQKHVFRSKPKRITKHVRVSERWYEYLRFQSKELDRPMSQVVDLALKYYSGEYKRERAELDKKYKALFPKTFL